MKRAMRNADISITKAIGIILMVVGHAGCPRIIHDIIYQFHMPLFLIMSGMCLKEEYIVNLKQFVRRKMIGIWWPYVKYGTIFLLLHNLFFRWNIYNTEYGYLGNGSTLYTAKDFLVQFSKVLRMTGTEQLLGGFWFLHALFWASIICVTMLAIIKHKYVSLGLLAITTILMSVIKVDIPVLWISSTTILAATFFMIGYCLKDINVSHWIYLIAIVSMFIGLKYGAYSMHISNPILILPYIFVAVACTLAVYKFSKFIVQWQNKYLSYIAYIGDNTMAIFVWHFISFKLVSLLIIAIYNLPNNFLAKFPVIEEYSKMGWWFFYSIIGVSIPLFVEYFLTKVSQFNCIDNVIIKR